MAILVSSLLLAVSPRYHTVDTFCKDKVFSGALMVVGHRAAIITIKVSKT